MDSGLLSHAIDLAYSTVDDTVSWDEFVRQLQRLLRADSALLFTPKGADDATGMDVRIGMDEWSLKAYRGHYKDHDLWYRGSKARNLDRPGTVVVGEELVDEPEFRNSEWFNDFLKPSRQCRLLGVNLEEGWLGSGPAFLNFYRSAECASFNEEDRANILLLLPHIQRAFRMKTDRLLERRRRTLLEGTLAACGTACIAIDRRMHLLLCNGMASDILAERDGLQLGRDGRLLCDWPGDGERMAAMVATLLSTARAAQAHETSQMLLRRRSGGGALFVQGGLLKRVEGEDCVIATLVVLKPGSRRTSVPILRGLGLSAAEARLAAIVGSGCSPAAAAEELRISEGNVRTALKKIFCKLGINRQSELATLVTRVGEGEIRGRSAPQGDGADAHTG